MDKIKKVLSRLSEFSSSDLVVRPLRLNHYDDNSFVFYDRNKAEQVYKVRLSSMANPTSVPNEYAALCLLNRAGKSWAPQVVEYRPEVPLLVTTFIEGKSLDMIPAWESQAVKIQTGLRSVLEDVHGISGNFFGSLYGHKYNSWLDFLTYKFWRYANIMEKLALIGPPEIRWIRELYEQSSIEISIAKPTLLHFDVKPANIIVNPEKGTVHLVDFELARFGDIDFEWVKVYVLSRSCAAYRRLVAPKLTNQSNSPENAFRPKIIIYMLYSAFALVDYEQRFGIKTPYRPRHFLGALLKWVRRSGTGQIHSLQEKR